MSKKALPDLPADKWIVHEDPLTQFQEALGSVEGNSAIVASNDLEATIRQLEIFDPEKRTVSVSTRFPASEWSIENVDDPHTLADVHLAVADGHLGVAENGAIWVTDEHTRQRVVWFLSQHLILLLDRDQIVHHMHAAYGRLTWENPSFGVFISGPRKTADIEQSLVIGPLGASSLTVMLLDN